MAFDIVLKVKDVASFVQWMQLLEPLFARNAPACLWFIKYMHEQKSTLEKLLLEDNNYGVREQFSLLLKTAINVTAKNEESYFFEQDSYLDFSNEENAPNYPEVKVYKSSVIRFMESFFGDLLDTKVRENWRRYDEYFECLRDFMKSSFLATSFVIQR